MTTKARSREHWLTQHLALTVTRVVIVQGRGPDKVGLTVDRPDGYSDSEDNLHLSFETSPHKAQQFIEEVLGLQVDEIIDTERGRVYP